MSSELRAKAEAIMMGMAQSVDSNEDAEIVIDFIMCTLRSMHQVHDYSLRGATILKEAFKYNLKQNPQVRYIHIGGFDDMIMLCLPMSTSPKGERKKFNVTSQNGAFSYVYNVTHPDLSELGYSFFQQTPRGLKRIG